MHTVARAMIRGCALRQPVLQRRLMIMRCLAILAGAGAVAFCSGCRSLFTVDCPGFGTFAVDIRLSDAATGAPMNTGAMAILTGAEQDSVEFTGDRFVGGNSAGTYSVRIRKSGYVDFTRDGLVVSREPCGDLETVKLDVALQPVR
jgi:hypothetical protein